MHTSTKSSKQWRHEKIFQYIAAHISHDAHIVELGPGTGIMLRKLHAAGFRYLAGADIIDYIKYQEIAALGIIKHADLNVEKAPFPDQVYDLVIALQIMEHLENPSHFQRECRRLLKPGGLLIISVPHGHNLPSKIRFFFTGNVMRFEQANEHITFLTQNIFKKIFLRGFTLQGVDYSPPNLYQLGIKLKLPDVKLFKKFFGHNITYFLRKE
ncbi:MAG: class I SAM-dependent methyltransferase [bacterium]|nr:class I SAM-dependent methyltransferase [bacterium]